MGFFELTRCFTLFARDGDLERYDIRSGRAGVKPEQVRILFREVLVLREGTNREEKR
jgi:hypothetical protein